MAGIAGDEPVAITTRRALISMSSPTATMSLSLKRASPSITRTPRPVKRSLESFGAIAAITPLHVIVHAGEIDRAAQTP